MDGGKRLHWCELNCYSCEWNHSCLTAAGKEDQIYKDLRKKLVGMQKAQESCVSIVTTNVFSGFKQLLPWVCLSYPPTYAQVPGHTTPRCRNNSDGILLMTNLPVPSGLAAQRSQSRTHSGGDGHQQKSEPAKPGPEAACPTAMTESFSLQGQAIWNSSPFHLKKNKNTNKITGTVENLKNKVSDGAFKNGRICSSGILLIYVLALKST